MAALLPSALAASPALLGAVALALAAITWLLQALYVAFTSPLRKVPGPFHTHFTHLRLKWAILAGRRCHYIHDLHLAYGPFVRIAPTEVAVADPHAFKEIHRIGSGFLKSVWYEQLASSVGIFTMRDPKQHGARRKLFARSFSKSELKKWEGPLWKMVELAVERIKAEMDADGQTDVLKWWTFLATDVSAQMMFGESFHTIEAGQKNEYIRTLESILKGSGIALELPLVRKIGKHIPTKTFQALFRADDYLLKCGAQLMEENRAHGNRTVFTNLDDAKDLDESGLTNHDVIHEARNLIVAGSDTTALTLTYLVWAVLKQPELQWKLEAEVAGLPDGFTDANTEALPLLNAVIQETLRLYSAAPGSLPRAVPSGGAQLGGYYIPEGVTVSTQSWSIHRDPALFPQPEKFDPSRWLSGEANMPEGAKLAFSPFGAGSRSCLGIHLAMMELRLTTAQFFRRCAGAGLAASTTDESMRIENYFVITPVSHRCLITGANP